MEPETIDAGRVAELHDARAHAEQTLQSAPPPPPPEAEPLVPSEPMTRAEHAALVQELAGQLSEVGGKHPDRKRLAAVVVLTYPAAKRWGRALDDVPAPVAIFLAFAGVGLLAVECGVIGPRQPAPQQQGDRERGRGA